MISNSMTHSNITIVAGLPRSGTSMMMRMLVAGGMHALVDDVRGADEDNPEGYYEYAGTTLLDKGNHAWLTYGQGKAVKVIASLLEYLPECFGYSIIFMHRHMDEILASQRKMILRRGESVDKISDVDMARLFENHLVKVKLWLQAQPNIKVLEVSYNHMIVSPQPQVHVINEFLGGNLNEAKMLAIIDPELYRNRIWDSPVNNS